MKARKMPNGKWRVDFREEGKGRTRVFKTQAQANAFIAELQHSKNQGTWINSRSRRIPVGEFLERYMQDRRHNLAVSSRYSYEQYLKNRIKPRWEHVPVGEVTRRDVQDWVNDLADELAPKTVRTIHGIFSGALKLAVLENCLSSNPCNGVQLPKVRRGEKVYMSLEQLEMLIDEANGDKKQLIRLQATTGMRFGEVAGLQVGDIDFARHRISIKRQAVTVGNAVHVKEALKTEGSRRVIAFSSKLDEELKELCKGKKKTDFLFTKKGTQEPLKRPEGPKSWLGCAVARIRAVDDDFPHVTSHDLRHTAVSLMVSVGAPISVISRQVGHKNISMTLDHYTELFDSDLDALTTAMDSIL